MSLNLNSLNGNVAPVNAPKGGPPIAVIIIVILVIIGIIVGVVMATAPAPAPKSQPPAPTPQTPSVTPVQPPATVPRPPATVPPPPATVPRPPATVPPPPAVTPAAYNVKQNAIAYLADPARTSKMMGTASGSLDVCKASCDGKPECTHFDRVGNSCTLYKGAEWVGSYPGGQSYCKSQCQT
jgi:hypothetical protein